MMKADEKSILSFEKRKVNSSFDRQWNETVFLPQGTFPNKDTVFEFYVDLTNPTWLHWEEQLKDGWIYNPEYEFRRISL